MKTTAIHQYLISTRVFWGPGSLARLPRLLGSRAKPLIVTDQGVIAAGLLDRLTKILREGGMDYGLFDRTQPDPPVEVVETAAEQYRRQGCNALIGLGGGSSLDTAKAVGIMVNNPLPLREYGAGKRLENPLPPLYAVPTTAGTGSEATNVTMISDTARQVKMVIGGWQISPQGAILDPELVVGLPARLAAETGADALSHAVEAYASSGANPFTDALALQAIRMIGRNLAPMVNRPASLETSGQMLAASCLAGMAFASAGLGLVHALSHVLGAHYHVGHGRACALYLPLVMEFNKPACPERYADIAAALGADITGLTKDQAAERAVLTVNSLLREIGLPGTYQDLGIPFELKPEMVDEIVGSVNQKTNPRASSADQLAALFRGHNT
ncbi:MAG: iron-containing alcohol dehydrogenase [Thermodesulfobacteriota bacterium]